MRGFATRARRCTIGTCALLRARGTLAATPLDVRIANLIYLLALVGCTEDVTILTEDTNATAGASVTYTKHLTGCHGQASSSIPSDSTYVLTSFGGPGDTQSMSCGGKANGTGWYAASRQRYGCGSHLMVQANGKCVVLNAMDYGPDVCVEAAAHAPILDVSPAAAKVLFNSSSAGWSDHFEVTVTEVSAGMPLGICTTESEPPPPAGTTTEGTSSTTTQTSSGAACASATLGRDVDSGTCVQAASDGLWYQCADGDWNNLDSGASCGVAYAYCDSATLGYPVPARTCVQSAASGSWYQCNGSSWVSPVSTASRSGALGACSTWNPL
jgi:hypothetical protein